MIDDEILEWLLSGDVSIQYQVYRDLLKHEKPELKQRIEQEGWGARFLSHRNSNGQWGQGFYQPKWISSHYTLLDLRNLCLPNNNQLVKETICKIIAEDKSPDGGINPARSIAQSDVCVNGMYLNYAAYFGATEDDLKSVIDFIISQQLPDGGFNCRFNRMGASHSSVHSTISVLEGIAEYAKSGYRYKLPELIKIEGESREFLLQHQLFKSHRTGQVFDKRMLMLSYPSRWRYDILRALDYFWHVKAPFDGRMMDALGVLKAKQRTDKRWPLQCKHPGATHFDMEITGKSSRWNTLRALRVINHFGV